MKTSLSDQPHHRHGMRSSQRTFSAIFQTRSQCGEFPRGAVRCTTTERHERGRLRRPPLRALQTRLRHEDQRPQRTQHRAAQSFARRIHAAQSQLVDPETLLHAFDERKRNENKRGTAGLAFLSSTAKVGQITILIPVLSSPACGWLFCI